MIQLIIAIIVGLTVLAMFTIIAIHDIKDPWWKETGDSSSHESGARR